MTDAGWSSLVARRAHNPKVVGSNPAPATNTMNTLTGVFLFLRTGHGHASNTLYSSSPPPVRRDGYPSR